MRPQMCSIIPPSPVYVSCVFKISGNCGCINNKTVFK